jgi:glycosyltransferase involved in cell wall biosynthesis
MTTTQRNAMALHLKARLRVLKQEAVDAVPFFTPGWRMAAVGSKLLAGVPRYSGLAARVAAQVHRAARDRKSRDAVEDMVRQAAWSSKDVRTWGQPKYIPERLLVVKPYVSNEEKGVLRVMFSELIRSLPNIPGFAALYERYHLVFAPSWSGAADPGMLQYAKLPHPITVLTNTPDDQAFLERMASSLDPIMLPPCCWADPRLAVPFLGRPKTFDIVMNASWAPWKRHFALFRALARLPERPKVALIGSAWDGGTRADMLDIARLYGVDGQLTIYEQITHEHVMDITSRSKVAILTSLKEGGNRALTEALLCDVPIIILDRHLGGFVEYANAATGLISSEENLAENLALLMDEENRIHPRDWAIDNMSCEVSSARLNTFIKDNSLARGGAWTVDTVAASTSPELGYYDNADERRFAEENEFVRLCFSERSPASPSRVGLDNLH